MIRLPNRKIHNRLNLLSIKTIYLHFRKYTVSTRKYHLPLRAKGLHKNKQREGYSHKNQGRWQQQHFGVGVQIQTNSTIPAKHKEAHKERILSSYTQKKLINQRGKIAHSDTVLSFLFSLFYRTPKPSKGFSKQHYRAILFYTLQTALSSFILLKCWGLCSRIMHSYLIAFPQTQLAERICMEINWYNLIPKTTLINRHGFSKFVDLPPNGGNKS